MSLQYRPLLPDIAKQDRGPPVGSFKKRKQAAHGQACEACRSCKTKCTGERPTCGKCLIRQTTCRYVETEARQATRKYEDLRKHRSTHEELLGLMTTLPEHDSLELFRRVRAGGDFGAILNHFKDGDLLLQMRLVPETRLRYELPYSRDLPVRLLVSQSPYLDSTVYEAASQPVSHPRMVENHPGEPNWRIVPDVDTSKYQSQYIKPYHSAVLVDSRLEKARPSEWTTVNKNDTLMRDMLAAYFTHEYHLFPVFHKDQFLEDMADAQGERSGTPCCSALLVNATLAYAFFCYDKFSNRYRYWDPESLGYRFLAEAKRIWEMHAINGELHSLTSVQAAMIINLVYNIIGLDKLGDLYGLQGIAIAKEIRLFDGNKDIASKRERHARNFTAWCLFNINVHLNWFFFRPPFFTKPPDFVLPDPSINPNWYGEIWTRYPLSPTLSQTHLAHYFKARSDYLLILHDLGHASFKKTSGLSSQQAMVFERRLSEWFSNLPAVFNPKYIVLPAHFLMHLDYYTVVMAVCQPFVHDQWDDGLNPRDIFSDAERQINILLRLYYIRHGFSGSDSWLISPLAKIGFLSLQSILNQTDPPDLEYSRSSLFLALKGLYEQGRSYYIARTVYYIVRNQVRPEEARLLMGSEILDSSADESPGLLGEVQSSWVPRAVSISDDPAAEELTVLAKQYLTMESGAQRNDEAGPDST